MRALRSLDGVANFLTGFLEFFSQSSETGFVGSCIMLLKKYFMGSCRRVLNKAR